MQKGYKNIFSDILFKGLFVTFLFVTTHINAATTNVKVQASIDSTHIIIGDQVNYILTLEQLPSQKVLFPQLKDSLTSKVEIVSELKADTVKLENGIIKITQKYIITSFDSGYYAIPPALFVVMSNIPDSIETNTVSLIVDNVKGKPNKSDIYDIKPLLKIPITIWEILKWVSIVLLILLVIAAVIYVIKRKQANKPIFGIAKPVEPAHVIAFRELETLKNEKLWQQGLYKQYFTRLTDTARAYIERRYEIPALESTSDELIGYIKEAKFINEGLLSKLEVLLRLADLVKFAKAEALPDDCENSWQNVYAFVNETKLIELNAEGQAKQA